MSKFLTALLALAACALAVDTRYWSLEALSDFEKGTLRKVALRNDGRLTLAPAIKELADPSLPYLWAVTPDPNGGVFSAGGPSSSKSPIFHLSRTGQSRKLAEIEGMNVFALATDKAGRLYAASSPDGKIYRIAANGTVETFYDPQAKYIWALAFLPSGDLLAATGDKSELHRISPDGKGQVWLKLDEDHVRSLAVDSKGNVYVGTEPNGLIVRVDAQGNPFVVYQSSKREVTALAAAPNGTLYAAIIGQKTAGGAPGNATITVPVVAPPPAPAAAPNAPRSVAPVAAVPPPTPVPGGSEIVSISPDGAPLRLWSHSSDVVYALGLDASGAVIAGTGNKGNLYRIENASQYTLLSSLSSSQITGFARDGQRLIAVTGNIGKIFEISATAETEGSYESEVFDGGGFTQWGRLHAKSTGTIRYETRSGNLERPNRLWSPWAPLRDGRVASPAARFLQFRAVLTTDASLSQIDLAYLPQNVAPRIDVVEATPANFQFPAPSPVISPLVQTLTLPAIGKSSPATSPAITDGANSPALTYKRGMIGARWLAVDDNGDTLDFKLEIKGEGEQTWKPLRDTLKDRYYSYDATGFADGRYQIRVTATDAPSNPLDQALTAQAVSAPFLIDNTAPVVSDLRATAASGKLAVRFRAVDALSVINKAEVSVNGGPWRLIEPTVRLYDSKDLSFEFTVERSGETTIAVRVTDEFDNQTVARTTTRE
jgi:hypothetical protein